MAFEYASVRHASERPLSVGGPAVTSAALPVAQRAGMPIAAPHSLRALSETGLRPQQRLRATPAGVLQRVEPARPQELLSKRLASSFRFETGVLNALPNERQQAYRALSRDDVKTIGLYRSANLNQLAIDAAILPETHRGQAETARAEVRLAVQATEVFRQEIETARAFEVVLDRRIGELQRGDAEAIKVGQIMQTFKQRAADDTRAAAAYLAEEFEQSRARSQADLGAALDDASIDRAKRGYHAAPRTLSLVNRLLDAAKAEASKPKRLYMISRAIRDLRSIGDSEMAQTGAAILADYLRPQVTALVYRFRPGIDAAPAWSLLDDVKNIGANDALTDVPADDPLRATIGQAWTTICQVVSPDVLNRAGSCAIRVHNSWLYRQNYSNGVIHLGTWRNSATVIQHEFGHHLEDTGNAARWIAIHQMLYERSAGRPLRSIFPFTIPWVISSAEQQYDVTMPAWWYTGGWFGYSAKYYASGSTEVVATTMEIINQPEKVFEVAIRDPELLLAVLGMLRD